MTLIAIGLTSLITQLITIYRERRNRRWDREDRELKARGVLDELVAHNERVSEATGRAMSEANSTNQKIAALQDRLEALIDALPCELNLPGRPGYCPKDPAVPSTRVG